MASIAKALIAQGDVQRPVTTLLVDRDSDTREMYAAYLRRSGQQVVEAEDGRDGLAKALMHRPDVIVTAMRLPGITGPELCRVLRRDPITTTTPIVFVSGDAMEDDVRRALAAGATSVLPKPCLPDRLLQEIARLVDRVKELNREADLLRAQSVSERARALPAVADTAPRRVKLNHSHERGMTTTPSLEPPALVCPICYQNLQYTRSFIGGVSARYPEQWDYFECATGCGTFQYRHRTRKLRQID